MLTLFYEFLLSHLQWPDTYNIEIGNYLHKKLSLVSVSHQKPS